MHPHPPGRSDKSRGQRQPASAASHGPGAERDAAGVRECLQDQMLVNQALAIRVYAYARATDALRDSESHLHALIAHQLAAGEAERLRLARELHDRLAQNLLALRLDVEALYHGTSARHRRLHKRAGAALDNLDLTLLSVKQLLGDLRPAGIELSLQAGVEIEVGKFTRTSGIACTLETDIPEEQAIPKAMVLTLYRVLQECLNNVLRHSLASRVLVKLSCTPGAITISVADNGIGFDPDAPRASACFGLFGLRERAAAAGGTLELRSMPLYGTEIRVSLPLGKPASPSIG